MGNSKNSVQARLKNLSKELNVSVNVLLATYFFDAFLLRLSKSEYVENFIFKGGFYLSAVIGVQNRYTQDLDFKLDKQKLDEENIRKIISEIISVPCEDEISFELSSVSLIREEDEYGGFTATLVGHLENIRQTVKVDIATGEPITPSAVTYKYKRLFENDFLDFKAYNLETILAEKLQTVFQRGLLNSRSKDFYDIYIIQKLKTSEITKENLRIAFERTCGYRNTYFSKDDVIKLLSNLIANEQVVLRWKNYTKKNSYAKGIHFDEAIKACKEFAEIIFN